MQNRDELRQKDSKETKKMMCRKGKKILFSEGWINIVFG
jgi:hypothetical protein